ncbi:hypothetical protein KEM60_00453 [Austwickia sp. TVS 96-490-7B]|uniref:EcsC family protein n=1 Tax=Austwickia sp. TVS 96-490-7B TaxID=2830843 RepID=UPI001C592EF8|nr:EcsC family protein [Austwickia sp. TVS 96-490-7B]MBW3084266.1 hypothetical protein [Austwickia sp. TVS 96-490-7B]
MMSEMSGYEIRAWLQIRAHLDRIDQAPQDTPAWWQRMNDAGASAVAGAKDFLDNPPDAQRTTHLLDKVPVSAKTKATAGKLAETAGAGVAKVGNAFSIAAQNVGRMTAHAAMATLSSERVMRSYRRHHVNVHTLEDIHRLDLEDADAQLRRTKIPLLYGFSSAASGGGAALAMTAGSIGAVTGGLLGAGIGSAPGMGTVAAAMTVDAAALLALNSRVVAHTALIYGYDSADPAERLFTMSVINLGSALTARSKQAARTDLVRLSHALANNSPWVVLNESLLAKVAQRFAAQYSVRLTQRKIGQIIPVAGLAVGAGTNYLTTTHVHDAAYWAYRERFLLDRYPHLLEALDADGGDGGAVPANDENWDDSDDVAFSVLDIVEDVRCH